MFEKMMHSIGASDTYILIAAVIVLLAFILVIVFCRTLTRILEESRRKYNAPGAQMPYRFLNMLYEIFLTGITIFPLLGLFGTVRALLGLDLTDDLAGAQQHFFDALTSTAWGIVFAVIFKCANAFISSWVEHTLEETAEMIERTSPGGKRDRI